MDIKEFLLAQQDKAEAFLTALIREPSDNPPGNLAPAAEHAARLLENLGFEVERHQIPPDLAHKHGMTSVTNLVIRESFGGDGPIIALNAHGDVVPPGTGWTRDPYGAEIEDDAIYGRGAAVSKSDFCSYAFALAALKQSGLPLHGSVELHFTYDEETGGELGPAWLLANGISTPDYAIAAGFSYAVTTAHNGCLHLEVTVTGRSAHAAKPELGADALEAATGIMAALYDLRAALRHKISATAGIGAPALTIGLIEGGINTNVVPDKVVFRLDRRIIPEEFLSTVKNSLVETIRSKTANYPGISVEIKDILRAAPLVPLPGSEKLAKILCKHGSEIFGENITTTGTPLYTDARHYAAANIPTILYGAGPRSIQAANAHGPDEHLMLSDLHRATQVLALSLAELLHP
jgi:acetylornithine deacetylase/succinyl-diaminopimelate desuccinylase family protein